MLVNKMLHDVARTNLCKGINGLTKKRCCIEASLFLRAIVKTYYFFIILYYLYIFYIHLDKARSEKRLFTC